MRWLSERLGEKSTYTGMAVIGSMLTMFAGPEAAQSAAPWVALFAGVIQTISKERGGK